jgi:tetratricopeptide (TPR) repeat protein
MDNHNHDHDHNNGCCDNNDDNVNNNQDHNHNHNHDHTNEDKIKSDANDYSRFNDIDDSDDELDKKVLNDDDKIKLPLEECLVQATSLKENGNDHIKNGNYNDAREKYEQAIKLLDDHKNVSSEMVINCLSSLHANNAMACLKVGNYKNAIESSNFVLKHDQNNVKALFRRGSAYLQQHSFDEAKTKKTVLSDKIRDLNNIFELNSEELKNF